jgi:hypothetical protein
MITLKIIGFVDLSIVRNSKVTIETSSGDEKEPHTLLSPLERAVSILDSETLCFLVILEFRTMNQSANPVALSTEPSPQTQWL